MNDVTKKMSTITKTICSPLSWIARKTVGLSEDSVHNTIDTIFKSYNKDGMSAHKAIDKIYKENGDTLKTLLKTPFLFVCTTKDFQMPAYSTVKLYYMLKEIGHESVDIFVTNKAHHGAIALFDRDNYAKASHGFYKKHNIPYDEKLAEEGLEILRKSEDEAKKIMEEYIHTLTQI